MMIKDNPSVSALQLKRLMRPGENHLTVGFDMLQVAKELVDHLNVNEKAYFALHVEEDFDMDWLFNGHYSKGDGSV